jgi:hypothetical protein
MTNPEPQISQILWEIVDEFCPRTIVIGGLILLVSTIADFDFSGRKLWLPSSIKFISSECLGQNKSIKSIVIENMSKLERIESEAFKRTSLNFFSIPNSVAFLGANCFSECGSLSSVTFESGSKLSRVGKQAFCLTGLIEIILPSSVEGLDEGCFFYRRSLSSVRFELGSRLSQIEKQPFV